MLVVRGILVSLLYLRHDWFRIDGGWVGGGGGWLAWSPAMGHPAAGGGGGPGPGPAMVSKEPSQSGEVVCSRQIIDLCPPGK